MEQETHSSAAFSRLQEELQQREERRLAAAQSYSSLTHEVEVKTKKLEKIWNALKVREGFRA